VLDVLMPAPNGLEVCRRIRGRGDRVPILMLTAHSLRSRNEATLEGAATQAPRLIRTISDQGTDIGTPAVIGTRPVTVNGTVVQFLPAPVASGTGDGFVTITERDVAVAAGEEGAYARTESYGGVKYQVHTAPLGSGSGIVRTALPVSVDNGTLNRLKTLLAALTAGGGILAAAAARLAAGEVLRPVRRLTDTVEHVTATQDLTAPIQTKGRDEIARLARSFAATMRALDESVQSQRRLVADASHEPRTPLTSITTNLELLDDGLGLDHPDAPLLVQDARILVRQIAQTHGGTVTAQPLRPGVRLRMSLPTVT
jgi:two-component system sensor histidine kinase MprB